MKKVLFAAAAAMLLLNFVSCKTANKSPEPPSGWAGAYTGVIPSAGGMGIDFKITLNADKTYTKEYRYIDKSDSVFTDSGTFELNPEGNTVILDNENKNDGPARYKIGENTLTQLDMEGNVITGNLADDYVLLKQ